MPKIDKRFTTRIVECRTFYLYRKHGNYYYAYYPEYKCSRSTKCYRIQDAYKKAWDILPTLSNPITSYYNLPESKKRLRDLRYILNIIPKDKPLTSQSIKDIQKLLTLRNCSPKTVNNYIYVLKQCYTEEFPFYKPLKVTNAVYRSCFPVKSFYGFWQKCSDRLDYLAFFAMTTGCRAGEIHNCEPYEDGYMRIKGTKTKNADRIIPVLPETIACLEYLKAGFRTSAYKESVVRAGSLCGFDEKYIEDNHIVFHSFRKMYKTLLESCEIPNNFIEYYMGHSQTRTVNQLYFIGGSADDTDIYPRVIEALKRFL